MAEAVTDAKPSIDDGDRQVLDDGRVLQPIIENRAGRPDLKRAVDRRHPVWTDKGLAAPRQQQGFIADFLGQMTIRIDAETGRRQGTAIAARHKSRLETKVFEHIIDRKRGWGFSRSAGDEIADATTGSAPGSPSCAIRPETTRP